jgi:hypothetical protein
MLIPARNAEASVPPGKVPGNVEAHKQFLAAM